MLNKNNRMSKPTLGQSMVEFAMVLPLFILLVMIIVDFGRGIWYYNAISNSAREGARFAIINEPVTHGDGKTKQHVRKTAVGVPILPSDILIVRDMTGAKRTDSTVTVTVQYEFVPITPLIGELLTDGKVNLSASSRMNLEY